MKKTGLMLAFVLVQCMAQADELGEAQKLWDQKNFTAAFQAFSKLAQSGNPAAQLQLGEMYGFGEGTVEDIGQATRWLEQAAKAGNKEAPASLELVRKRAAHKADIQWYVQEFDGADARYEKFACAAPVVPPLSKTNPEIQAVNAAVQAWTACYGRFAANLNAKAPVQNTIPSKVLDLMNNDEFTRASAHIGKVYTAIADQAQLSADNVTKTVAAWRQATEQYVTDYNKKTTTELRLLQTINDTDTKAISEMMQGRSTQRGGK